MRGIISQKGCFTYFVSGVFQQPARERRFFIIDVGEKHLQDHAYFKAISDQMDNGGREALLYYLMSYDISGMNLRQYPQTAALREAKMLSASPAQKFWLHILETGNLQSTNDGGWGDGIIQTNDLYKKYQDFVQDMGIKHKATSTELGMQLVKMMPKAGFKKGKASVGTYKGTERKYCYTFPSLDECRKAFNVLMNSEFEWPEE